MNVQRGKTRLDRFIRERGLYQLDLANATNIARQRIHQWSVGRSSPRLKNVRKLVHGVRKLTGDPHINANDLFRLDDDE
jgi:DNA-binding XRE family transcriptional regulator